MARNPLNSGRNVVIPCRHSNLGSAWEVLNNANQGVPVLATGEALEISSDSANDTAAGTGARTVKMIYLDVTGTVQDETITLNGVGWVATAATSVGRIIDLYCASYGSGGTNAGNITIRTVVGTLSRGYLHAGTKRAGLAQFTVPLGYVFGLRGLMVSNANVASTTPLSSLYRVEADVDLALMTLNEGVFVPVAQGIAGLHKAAQMQLPQNFVIELPELTTVRAVGFSATAATDVSASIVGTIRRKPVTPEVPIGA